MEKDVVVECINLEKKYFLFDKDYKVIPWLFTKKGTSEIRTPLSNINLTIKKGEVVGFVGKNGAGKSTLMKIIAGITMHTDGDLTVKGKVNSLINLGAGFNPKYTGRQNIYYKGFLMGMSREEVDEIIDKIIDFCELGAYFDLPIYMYSSGMSARLGFALAIFADHDILIVDEVFSVGDKMFREKSAEKMEELFKSGKSIIFASHSDSQIKKFCNRAIFIDDSHIVVDGTVDEVLNAYNKKYAPSKFVKKVEDFKDEFEKSDGFMKMINTTVRVPKNDLFREIGVMCEYDNEFQQAYYYMTLAKEIKPNDSVVNEKLLSFKNKLEDNITVEALDLVSEKSNTNIRDMVMKVNNRNNPYKKHDLYRDLAVFHELEGDLKKAVKYISLAKQLNSEDAFILKKFEEYEGLLSNNK